MSFVVLSREVLCIVQQTFAKEGLSYTMDGQTGNTLNSHRLIALAGQQGLDKQDKLVELLFTAYFTQVQQQILSCLGAHPEASDLSLCMIVWGPASSHSDHM